MRIIIPIIILALLLGSSVALMILTSDNQQNNTKISNRELELAEKQNQFGFDLIKQLDDETVFISPASISLALSMVYNGAEEETKQEMESVLNFEGLTREEINIASKNLIDYLENSEEVKLYIANSIWARKGIPFNQEFLDANEKYFDAEINNLDFSNPDSVNVINNWVSENTKNKIEKIVDEISSEEVMFLINAIYFKDLWINEFDKDLTSEREFHLSEEETIKVDMMQQEESFRYYEDDSLQIIELPYEGNLSMIVFLPENLNNFIEDLDNEYFGKIDSAEKQKGTLLMPKFELEYEKELNGVLKQLGMSKAFNPAEANFKGIADLSENLYINYIKHKSYVKVDEEGTEAAAVTSVSVGITSVGPQGFYMEVNKPFFFAIRDNKTHSVLFMGKISNPNE